MIVHDQSRGGVRFRVEVVEDESHDSVVVSLEIDGRLDERRYSCSGRATSADLGAAGERLFEMMADALDARRPSAPTDVKCLLRALARHYPTPLPQRVVERLVQALTRNAYPLPWRVVGDAVASADGLVVIWCSPSWAATVCAVANGEEPVPTSGSSSDQAVLDAVESVRRWHPDRGEEGCASHDYNLLADFAELAIARGERS